jgi:hypothetical protein
MNFMGIAGVGAGLWVGLMLIAQGALLLAGGRMTSCLAAIERNTRRTLEQVAQ